MCAAALLIGGCNSVSLTGFQTARTILRGTPDPTPDAAAVAANPYAQLRVEGGGIRALMLLGNDDAGRLSWFAGSHVVFLRDGQLAGTQGLSVDLEDMRIEGDNPFEHLQQVGDRPVVVQRRYDWRAGYRFGVPVTGELVRGELEQVDILGTSHALVRYDETLSGPGVRARNVYWAEADTGYIRKSRQMIAPGAELEIVVLKPYRGRAR
ncbi:YjbF family lipoprotein [Stenotrophomonas panacihumi]|nr:YjbF family lipoprotein [Stenotrophomonas panacihumi]